MAKKSPLEKKITSDLTQTADPVQGGSNAKLKFARWPLSRLKPYKLNARKHPADQVSKLAALITKHGFDVPIVVDGAGTIIKGHGRFAAAKKAGLKEVPVVIRDDLSEAQIREARIADNRVAELSEWDEELLGQDVREAMELEDFDTGILGFEDIPGLDLTEIEPQADDKATNGLGSPVIQYTIVFDDEAQQKRFFDLLKQLKLKYPKLTTIASRFDKWVAERKA